MTLLPNISFSERRENATEREIIRAIAQETQAFKNADWDAWSACWVHAPRTRDIYASQSAGLHRRFGWQEIAEEMKEAFEKDLVCKVHHFHQENHHIQIIGNVAWVTFDGRAETYAQTTEHTLETRILERAEEGWKIVYSCVLQARDPNTSDRQVAVDGKGMVTWISAPCRDFLRAHPVLTISQGRLRAQRPEWDQILQGEIEKSGSKRSYLALWHFAFETGHALRYPVILGTKDDGGVASVILSVRDSTIYVTPQDDAISPLRLSAAQSVFGLSDGQTRVAEMIAMGYGLKRIAEELGISVNTARTHLTRIYEKTGVNAQTALVRILLSVG